VDKEHVLIVEWQTYMTNYQPPIAWEHFEWFYDSFAWSAG
jgi:hypothetical protein